MAVAFDMTTLEITAPDDLHLHVRDGNMLKAVLPHTTRIFRRSGVRMRGGGRWHVRARR